MSNFKELSRLQASLAQEFIEAQSTRAQLEKLLQMEQGLIELKRSLSEELPNHYVFPIQSWDTVDMEAYLLMEKSKRPSVLRLLAEGYLERYLPDNFSKTFDLKGESPEKALVLAFMKEIYEQVERFLSKTPHSEGEIFVMGYRPSDSLVMVVEEIVQQFNLRDRIRWLEVDYPNKQPIGLMIFK